MSFIFDGPAKLITLTSGTTTIDVAGMYSRWVDWISLSDNSKYLQAFRVVGGDAITDNKNLCLTFFIINGWRIRPQESNHRLTVVGNLYTDNPAISPFVPTVDDWNVVIEQQVSNLIDTIEIAGSGTSTIQDYKSTVHINEMSGFTGTAWPNGTNERPVNNITDAITIAVINGIDTFTVKNQLTIGSGINISGFKIKGSRNPLFDKVILADGSITSDCQFETISVEGFASGVNVLTNCIVGEFANFSGIIENSMLSETVLTLAASEPTKTKTVIANCYSDSAEDDFAVIDFSNNTEDQLLVIRNFKGNLAFVNKISNSQISADVQGSKVTIADTFDSTGISVFRGIGSVVNLGSANIQSELIVNQEFSGALTIAQDKKLDELHKLQGLDIANPMLVTSTARIVADIELDLLQPNNDGAVVVSRR